MLQWDQLQREQSQNPDGAVRIKDVDKMKTKLILLLYDSFLSGETVDRVSFCVQYAISERTFYRYMNELYLFLREFKKVWFIDVEEPDGRYQLKKTENML